MAIGAVFGKSKTRPVFVRNLELTEQGFNPRRMAAQARRFNTEYRREQERRKNG